MKTVLLFFFLLFSSSFDYCCYYFYYYYYYSFRSSFLLQLTVLSFVRQLYLDLLVLVVRQLFLSIVLLFIFNIIGHARWKAMVN